MEQPIEDKKLLLILTPLIIMSTQYTYWSKNIRNNQALIKKITECLESDYASVVVNQHIQAGCPADVLWYTEKDGIEKAEVQLSSGILVVGLELLCVANVNISRRLLYGIKLKSEVKTAPNTCECIFQRFVFPFVTWELFDDDAVRLKVADWTTNNVEPYPSDYYVIVFGDRNDRDQFTQSLGYGCMQPIELIKDLNKKKGPLAEIKEFKQLKSLLHKKKIDALKHNDKPNPGRLETSRDRQNFASFFQNVQNINIKKSDINDKISESAPAILEPVSPPPAKEVPHMRQTNPKPSSPDNSNPQVSSLDLSTNVNSSKDTRDTDIRSPTSVKALTTPAGNITRPSLSSPPNSQESPIVNQVVVVGDNGVGKAFLLKGHAEMSVAMSQDDCDSKINPRNISFNLWDTPDSNECADFRRQIYSTADVILLCFSFDHKDSLKNIETKWLPEVRKYCPTAAIIVAGNTGHQRSKIGTFFHFDLAQLVSDKIREMSNWMGAYAYVEYSDVTQEGIENVFRTVAKAAIRKNIKSSQSYWWCPIL